MPIPFRCPHCGHETLVDDAYAGSSGPCASCGRTVVMPSVSPSSTSSPPSSQKSTLLVILIVVGVTGFMFLFMCCGMLMMFRVTSIERRDTFEKKIEESLDEYQETFESEGIEIAPDPPVEESVEEPTEEVEEADDVDTEEEIAGEETESEDVE